MFNFVRDLLPDFFPGQEHTLSNHKVFKKGIRDPGSCESL